MYSVCIVKHVLERGVIVLDVLGKPLLGELWLGQGLCERLDVSLLQIVGVGLTTCEGVRVVNRVHTLFGGVHLATALTEVEEVREEVREIRDECEDEEVEENGGFKVEEKRSS